MGKLYSKNGMVVSNSRPIEIDGLMVVNATYRQLLADGWVEYTPPTPEPHIETEEEKTQRYAYRVSELIREKYSIDDEMALHRQKESKREEWAEYNTYCEECKVNAKAEVYGTEG